MTTHGVRLNNPGNLRREAGTVWRGQSPVQTDVKFVQFDSPIYGLRALALLLLNYQRIHGLRTVRELVSRWAPPSDRNDTEAYIADVADRMGVLPDQVVVLDVGTHMLQLMVVAIVQHENGAQPYPAYLVADAVQLATVSV